MASQVSTSAPGGDSFLYSFTPGVTGRGGVAITTPQGSQPLSNARRIRTQSMTGEPALKQESSESFPDPPASPRSSLPLTSRSPSLRSGSADRPHTVGSPPLSSSLSGSPLASSPGPLGSSGIKPPPLGAIGSPCLRQSLNTTPAGGLPKLDFHSGLGGVLSSPVELPALTMIGSMRRSHNANISSGGAAAASDSGAATEGSPLNMSGLDMVPSPRQGILAPLRSPVLHNAGVLSTSPASSTNPAMGSNASSGASSPASTSGDTMNGGMSSYNGPSRLASAVGTSSASGFPSTTGGGARRNGPTALSMDVPPVTPSGLAVYDAWTSTPVTPPSATPSAPTAPPRRSLSANSRARAAGGTTRPREAGPASSGPEDHDDPNYNTATKLLSGINDDIQRAAGAISAMHAPGGKPLTVAQLTELRKSAPELREEIRGAVRRAFQVLRQEVSVAAVAGSRQMGLCVEDLGATVDAYLEDTAGLTSMLVNGSLAAATGTPGGVSSTVSGGSGDGVSGSGSSGREGSQSGVQEVQRQLERMRLRLMEAERRAAMAEAAAREVSGSAAIAGTGPRPPSPLACPPLERGPGASPRRGRHARALSTDGGSKASGASNGPVPADISETGSPLSKTDSSGNRRQPRGTHSSDGSSGGITLRADFGTGNREPSNTSDCSLRSFERAVGVVCGSSKGSGEMVIEEEASDEEKADDGTREARRCMLTIHSASFAEWARRR